MPTSRLLALLPSINVLISVALSFFCFWCALTASDLAALSITGIHNNKDNDSKPITLNLMEESHKTAKVMNLINDLTKSHPVCLMFLAMFIKALLSHKNITQEWVIWQFIYQRLFQKVVLSLWNVVCISFLLHAHGIFIDKTFGKLIIDQFTWNVRICKLSAHSRYPHSSS